MSGGDQYIVLCLRTQNTKGKSANIDSVCEATERSNPRTNKQMHLLCYSTLARLSALAGATINNELCKSVWLILGLTFIQNRRPHLLLGKIRRGQFVTDGWLLNSESLVSLSTKLYINLDAKPEIQFLNKLYTATQRKNKKICTMYLFFFKSSCSNFCNTTYTK